MKTTQTLLVAVILSTCLLTATGAQAALQNRLGGLAVYDTDLNVTWLTSANNSYMNWYQANAWATGLTVDGFSGWRLPTTTDTGAPGCDWANSGTDCGWNVNTVTGEMAHLYFDELHNKSYSDASGNPQPGWGLVNKGPFSNLQSNYYWSGTEYAPSTYYAWHFGTNYGNQNADDKGYNMFALAVRPGDVAAVPVPAAAWLLGSGLLGLIGVARRQR